LAAAAFGQTATAWPEADRLFHSYPRWLGADAAYSFDLGNQRVLWLFGDSFVGGLKWRRSRMVRNSIAIQKGYDPSAASIRFYWGGKLTFFFPEEGRRRFHARTSAPHPNNNAETGSGVAVGGPETNSTSTASRPR